MPAPKRVRLVPVQGAGLADELYQDPQTGQFYDAFGDPVDEKGNPVKGERVVNSAPEGSPEFEGSNGDTLVRDPPTGQVSAPEGKYISPERKSFEETRAKRLKPQLEEEERQADAERETKALQRAQRYADSNGKQSYLNGQLVQTYTIYLTEDGVQTTADDPNGVAQTVRMVGGQAVGANADQDSGSLSARERGANTAKAEGRRATYNLLGLNEIYADREFVMSQGFTLNDDGEEFTWKDGGDDPRRQAITATRGAKDATNLMTVEGGVTWFRNLSKSDPDLYNEYIDLLVKSDYLPEDAARRNAYTTNAGSAFATAAVDAGENWTAGTQDDLRTFLQKMKAQTEESKAAAYTPETRRYIDPAALAQTARQAAEDMLGRIMSDEEVTAFQSKFRGLEDGYYNQIDAAAQNGGARVADPNAAGQAEETIRDDPQYNTERAGTLVGDYMGVLNRLIGG